MTGATRLPASSPGASTARRRPVQQRSQDRLERILSVAKGLIAQRGSEPLKMSEIAEMAEISIGSLYQYFPDKQSILRMLAEQYTAESRRCIDEALAAVHDKASLAAAFSSLVDQYHAMFLKSPVRRDIISGMRADRALMAIELAESKVCGGFLAAAIQRAHPWVDKKRVDTLAFLIWQLGEETMRLALMHKRSEGASLVEAYKRMSLRAMAEP
jgi:AcrR family transcriptional regulator